MFVLWSIMGGVLALAGAAWAWRALMHRCEAARRADWGRPWLNRLDGLNRIFCQRFHRLRPVHLDLPAHGAALVVANHVSGLDPLLMIAACTRPLRFMIAREQYDRWWLRWLFQAVGCIPVERRSDPHAALAAARRALAAGEVVALFPYGGIYLDHETPLRPKRGIAHLARVSGAPVYPLRLTGIRGAGMTLAAVALRSRVRVARFPALYYDDKAPDELLLRLAPLLTGRHRS